MLQNQKGIAHILLILTVLGIVATFLILNTFSFNSKTFSRLFVRNKSLASSDTIQIVDAGGTQITTTTSSTVKVKLTEPVWTSAQPSSIPSQGTNLVKNPGCETDLSGWSSWHGTLNRVTNVAHSGLASCQVNVSDNTLGGYTIDDNPNSVIFSSTTPAIVGKQYKATAWVRSDITAIIPATKPATITLRLKGGAGPQKNFESPRIKLTNNWQQVCTTASIDSADRTSLDTYVAQYNQTNGDNFQVDDISFTEDSTPCPNPTPIPGNLVSNPSCNLNTLDWNSWHGTLSSVTTGGHSGSTACQVNVTSGTTGGYTIDDNPATITYSAGAPVGHQYTSSAWVRSDVAVGKPASLVLRIKGGVNPLKNIESTKVFLSTSWQQVKVTTAMDFPDRSTVEVYLAQYNQASGDNFQASDISLTDDTVTNPTASVTLAEDPNFQANVQTFNYPLTSNPVNYTFSDPTPGNKLIYAKFTGSDGSTQNASPFPASISLLSSSNGYTAVFYNDPNFGVPPCIVRTDNIINYNWSSGSPGACINSQNFSALFTGYILANNSNGSFNQTFYVNKGSTDTAHLLINGQTVLSDLGDPSKGNLSGNFTISAGQRYNFTLYYTHGTSNGLLNLSWLNPLDNSQQIIPANYYFTNDGSAPKPSPTLSPTPSPSIFPGSVNVTYPNGGETFNKGDPLHITWQASNCSNFSIDWHDNLFTSGNIATNLPGNSSSYDWVINLGNLTNSQFKITIRCYVIGVGSIQDDSDNFFTVNQPVPTANPTPSPAPSSSGTTTGSLTVDRTDVNVTLSRSSSTDGYNIYGSGFNLTSNGPTSYTLNYIGGYKGYGFDLYFGGLAVGRTQPFRSYITTTKPNGIYTGSAIITYPNATGTWVNGPTVNFSITLTD